MGGSAKEQVLEAVSSMTSRLRSQQVEGIDLELVCAAGYKCLLISGMGA